MTTQPATCEVPLVEQLESVPADGRLVIDDSDGMGTSYIPVGRMSHDAAAELRRLQAENEALKADAERLDWCISVLFGGGWLTTDVGCGCCGDGKSFDSDITGRAAIDAVRGKA